jgi:hypothetical protein
MAFGMSSSKETSAPTPWSGRHGSARNWIIGSM